MMDTKILLEKSIPQSGLGRNKRMKNNSTNMYILNLAFADLIMACGMKFSFNFKYGDQMVILFFLVAVPITPWYTFSGDWIFGRILCNIFAASQVL